MEKYIIAILIPKGDDGYDRHYYTGNSIKPREHEAFEYIIEKEALRQAQKMAANYLLENKEDHRVQVYKSEYKPFKEVGFYCERLK